MSPIARSICGVLGFGGIVAIAFNAYSEGGVNLDFVFYSGLFGAFVFLYVAISGNPPWSETSYFDDGERKMSRVKWQKFWVATVTFLAICTAFLAEKGVFENADIVTLLIVGLLFAVVGVALYVYVKGRPEDIHW